MKNAWRLGYHGLATLLAVAWDSQLSTVDARKLHAGDMRRDPGGAWFEVARAKTGRAARATLSRRSLAAYLEGLPAEPLGVAPLFRNRSLVDPIQRMRWATISATCAPRCWGTASDGSSQISGGPGATEALAGNVPPRAVLEDGEHPFSIE